MVAAAATPDVRAHALAAATRLFAALGFEGTSIQAIADAVGVTKQAVLHHFPSKELLRQAVLEAILAHWNDALPRLLLAASASEDRFSAVFGELQRFFASDPDRALVVLREALDRPAEMRKLLRGPVRPWLSAVAGYIRSGQESGHHYPDVDAEIYVVHVLQLVIAAAASARVSAAILDVNAQGAPTKEARARYDKELTRIARASLFVPRVSKPKSPKPPPKGKR